jgi:hypothetical protein
MAFEGEYQHGMTTALQVFDAMQEQQQGLPAILSSRCRTFRSMCRDVLSSSISAGQVLRQVCVRRAAPPARHLPTCTVHRQGGGGVMHALLVCCNIAGVETHFFGLMCSKSQRSREC